MNRGLKSSSLHYAACFGRPNIVKLLLQYGADPDLRDEDGHTPLEKAQERGDEWHRQVIEILENPSTLCVGVWVCVCVCVHHLLAEFGVIQCNLLQRTSFKVDTP